ncbi:MAG: thiolase domain-containing protein [Ardenticatenaceae bacterium]|nr:thiolase domain-containing protein [Ardenticatenaceae bacterium]
MNQISIIGLGRTAVGEHWDVSLRHLAWQAIEAALDDAKTTDIDALYVGNMLAGRLSHQDHLGALIADYSGLRGAEAVAVEAGEASGAIALRQALLAVKSGEIKTALVVGVEKATDQTGSEALSAQSTSLDADYETMHGVTPAAVAGLMMQRYMHEHQVELENFAGFSVNAHANAGANPLAMYRNRLKAERFAAAPVVSAPVNLFDAAPVADGAAAVVITSHERALAMAPKPVRIAGSAVATDGFALHDRQDILWLSAVTKSTQAALKRANLAIEDIQLFELHDSYTVMSALALEAIGLAERGQGWQLAAEGKIGRDGPYPMSTFGGLKARGNPLGATGLYQVVEASLQLRGEAGDCQIPDVKIGLTQNLGGSGATAVTHILRV